MFAILDSNYKMEYLTKVMQNDEYMQKIYTAMESDDLCEPVMLILKLLKQYSFSYFLKHKKDELLSNKYRTEGNNYYKNRMFQKALRQYNKALVFAPYKSRAMKLAYSNRSALLLAMEHYKACLDDISTCISMGCPDDIIEKIRARRETAVMNLWTENLKNSRKCEFAEDFFKLPNRNQDVPCASSNINIIMDSTGHKIVAKTDIKVGTLLAIEKAFAISAFSHLKTDKIYTSCYYCFKMSLNLFPCDNCCLALFCSKKCKETCLKEYHNIECDVIQLVEHRHETHIPLRAAIKMRNMCNSWNEFISLSSVCGEEKLKSSSINEIYDSKNISSFLTFNRYIHFKNGVAFNASLIWAVCIISMEFSGNFFPEHEKEDAIRAFAKILMHLTLFASTTYVTLSESQTDNESIKHTQVLSFGLFPFIGKLKHSCMPNTRPTALNNNMALIAIQPIKAGTELTVSPVFHWLEYPQSRKARCDMMWWVHRKICECQICDSNLYDMELKMEYTLSAAQKRSYKKLASQLIGANKDYYITKAISTDFRKFSECLELLSDVPFSKEYANVYRQFRTCLLFLQNYKCKNIVLDAVNDLK